jgi:hypothetical protein
MTEPEHPFVDLPAGLVDEVLDKTAAIGDLLLKAFRDAQDGREILRKSLQSSGLLRKDSELGYPPLPTTCAADGSYAVERLLSIDLAAAAAVAVEGLTPPSEKRYWEGPTHSTYIVAERHSIDTPTILRAVMLGRELLLARKAPHELVMLDMTFTLPTIYFNQALNLAPHSKELQCSLEFLDHCIEYLEAYRDLLRTERSDKNFISMPKYSTRREIGLKCEWPGSQDDRSTLTQLLEPGEFTSPVLLEQPEQEWHFNFGGLEPNKKAAVSALTTEIAQSLSSLRVIHYKPHAWLPALRIELGVSAAANEHRVAAVLQGLKHQCATAGMFEPYPLYLADRTVKALARSLPAFRHVATQRVSEQYDGEIADVFFAMHGYRTESGG